MPVPVEELVGEQEATQADTDTIEADAPPMPACFDSLVALQLVNPQIADALAEVDPTYRDVTLRSAKHAIPIRKALNHFFPDFLTGAAAELGACGLVRATIEPALKNELPINFVFVLTPQLVKQLIPQQESHDPGAALGNLDLSKVSKEMQAVLPVLNVMMQTMSGIGQQLKMLQEQFVAPQAEHARKFNELMANATMRRMQRWTEQADEKPLTVAEATTQATQALRETFGAVKEASQALQSLAPNQPITPERIFAGVTSPKARQAAAGFLKLLGGKVPIDPTAQAGPEHQQYADVPEEPGSTKSMFGAPAARNPA